MSLRERVLGRVERSVQRRGYPRTAVALIVGFAATLSFILSVVLVEVGLDHMGVRYLVCLGFGYGVFLGLLRFVASRHSVDIDPGLDIPISKGFEDRLPDSVAGEGGDFGGGGASGSWSSDAIDPSATAGSGSAHAMTDVTGAFDLDDGWAFLIPVLMLVSGVLAGGYVVAIAPVLVAEVALDLAVAAGAYRAASRLAPQHWCVGAIRRTWLVAACLGALVGGLGFLLQTLAPNAHTIGAALESL